MRKQPLRIVGCAIAFSTLSFFVMSCKKNVHASDTTIKGKVSASLAATYQLIWSDEFDGTTVNTGNWNIDNGNPNVNNELEYYQE